MKNKKITKTNLQDSEERANSQGYGERPDQVKAKSATESKEKRQK